MKGLRLYKQEKLCSLTAIDSLFLPDRQPESRHTAMAYPWRAVWRMRGGEEPAACSRFLISVPKKRVRHAVDRVRLRRQCREAYRLSRHLLSEGRHADIAFIYVGNSVKADYQATERSIHKILGKINECE